ncbi:MAG: hypothetical protein A2621_03595 [Alphaproteobacteria bacterium RIFCSPHIGHO2_01_FULL_41_14]|nr:MAG: hypothetical protein A3K20_03395 [Alphaproteobacteria bacterium GWA1_45_9]OFW89937.1 MAG: hypothetical protein A2621_03595 [Alphaproteobacteria bacterium RIFCSPHIGHO2_01_FULL_41_14]
MEFNMKNICSFFGFLLIGFHVHSALLDQNNIDIDLSRRSITSPSISCCFRGHRPLDTTSVIDYLKEIPEASTRVKSLNLNDNIITLEGATEIIDYINKNLPSLTRLNLSFNRLYETGWDEQEKFEQTLNTLLAKERFEKINLEGNGIACFPWIQKMSFLGLGQNVYGKIQW